MRLTRKRSRASALGRRVRVAVASDATHNFSREDFAADEKRLYFTLAAWESDVGVMELVKRR
jgi:hypothetical protein